jgi:hypothetical protein
MNLRITMICKRGCPPTNHIASYVLYGRKNKDEIIIVIDTVDNPIENGCCPYISGQPTLSIYISAEYQKLVGRSPHRQHACPPCLLCPTISHTHVTVFHTSVLCLGSSASGDTISVLWRHVAPCTFGGVFRCHGLRRGCLTRLWVRVARHPWMQRASIFFVCCHVLVHSACMHPVTQDRGTRVPPVKSVSVCCRQALRIGMCTNLEYAFLTGFGPGWLWYWNWIRDWPWT